MSTISQYAKAIIGALVAGMGAVGLRVGEHPGARVAPSSCWPLAD